MKKFALSFFLTFAVLITVWFAVEKLAVKRNEAPVQPDVPVVDDTKDVQEFVDTGKDETLVLLLGVDRDPGAKLEDQGVTLVERKMKELIAQGAESYNFFTANRSDVIYIAKFNKKTGKITMMSLPRDLRTNIGGGDVDKINAAYSYYGPYGALDAVRNFTKIDIEYFVVFDYGAVESLIDAMGGITYNVPIDMDYEDPRDKTPLVIHLKAGEQLLSGTDAVHLLRFRAAYKNEGDIGRVKAQHEFIKAFFKQALSVENIPKLPKLVDKALASIYTNVPMEEVLSVISYAKNADTQNISMNIVPGEGQYIGGISFYIHDKEATTKMIFDLFGDNLIQ